MGYGKTEGAIKFIRRYKRQRKFIYVTPYVDEVKRVSWKTRLDEPAPIGYGKGKKRIDFIDLLKRQVSFATTHSLFSSLKPEDNDLLNEYTLILDEVMEPIEVTDISKKDMEMLISSGKFEIESNGSLWLKDEEYDGRFNWLKDKVLKSWVMTVDGTHFFEMFNPDVWRHFKEIYVLTYMFEASNLRNYFKYWNIPYHPEKKPDGLIRKELKTLINIYKGDMNKINEKNKFAFSKSWYLKRKESDFKIIRSKVRNMLNRNFKSTSKLSAFTTYVDFKDKIADKGYKKEFISLNARATNDFQHKKNLAYLVNRYPNPDITSLLGVNVDDINIDKWALSEMIQWIFRSAIRNKESINIYIPSTRMRNLLERWLEGEI